MAVRSEVSSGTVLRILTVVTGFALVLYAAYLIRSILVLVFVAAFLAVGLDPAVRLLERLRLKRGPAIATIFFVMLLFIVGFVAAIAPPLYQQITTFASDLPQTLQDVSEANPRIREFVEENDIAGRLQDATKNVPSLVGGSLARVVGIAGSVVSAIFKTLTVVVLTMYFLASLSRMRAGTLRLVPRSKRARVSDILEPILEKIGAYVGGNLSISLIAGVLACIFLLIADVPFPVALALWVAIADLIPMVGATLGAIPAVLVAFATSIPQGIATLVYFIIYQQFENYVVAPRVMTKAVDLSPAAVLLAALIGAELLGFVGALIAIPAAAAVKLVAQQVVIPRTEAA